MIYSGHGCEGARTRKGVKNRTSYGKKLNEMSDKEKIHRWVSVSVKNLHRSELLTEKKGGRNLPGSGSGASLRLLDKLLPLSPLCTS